MYAKITSLKIRNSNLHYNFMLFSKVILISHLVLKKRRKRYIYILILTNFDLCLMEALTPNTYCLEDTSKI